MAVSDVGWLAFVLHPRGLVAEPFEPLGPGRLILLDAEVAMEAAQLPRHRHDDATREVEDEIEGGDPLEDQQARL